MIKQLSFSSEMILAEKFINEIEIYYQDAGRYVLATGYSVLSSRSVRARKI